MPTIQEMICLSPPTTNAVGPDKETTSSSISDLSSRDIESLVSQIKENFRLSSSSGIGGAGSFKCRSAARRSIRTSPYSIPSRSWNESFCGCESCSCSQIKNSYNTLSGSPPTVGATGNNGTTAPPSCLSAINYEHNYCDGHISRSIGANSSANNNGYTGLSNSMRRLNVGSRGAAAGKRSTSDDPYKMLQELLQNGCLITEAVRRLEKGLGKAAVTKKSRYSFYDDEEEFN